VCRQHFLHALHQLRGPLYISAAAVGRRRNYVTLTYATDSLRYRKYRVVENDDKIFFNVFILLRYFVISGVAQSI
jgi:hypothetical protein